MAVCEMNPIRITACSSIANLGPGFDIESLGLVNPHLDVTYTRTAKKGVEIEVESPAVAPPEKELGYAGRLALSHFLSKHDIREGAHIFYKDKDYLVGGRGRSGAEAVLAIMSAAINYEIPLTRNEVVIWSAHGEPGHHMDNVAGSINGRFNIISVSPITGEPSVDVIDPPPNLGIATIITSHQKPGTETMRQALKDPVEAEDFVIQQGLIAASIAALARGDVDRYLELVIGDRFHEPRRADIKGYGNFNASDFFELKKMLFKKLGVALVVAGAGPNMVTLYNKNDYPDGVEKIVPPLIVPWFKDKQMRVLKIEDVETAKGGAYDYAIKHYGYKEPRRK